MDYGWVNVGFLLSGGNFSIPKPNLLFWIYNSEFEIQSHEVEM
jgi:hypothetical protein